MIGGNFWKLSLSLSLSPALSLLFSTSILLLFKSLFDWYDKYLAIYSAGICFYSTKKAPPNIDECEYEWNKKSITRSFNQI